MELLIALVGVLGTLVAALGSQSITVRAQRAERVATESREQRSKAYEQLLVAMRVKNFQFNSAAFSPPILLYGSDDVVRAWNSLLKLSAAHTSHRERARQMRSDRRALRAGFAMRGAKRAWSPDGRRRNLQAGRK
jgi:hypothetical protein